ncbi:MAG TPA: FIST C-terminal domain-containing protein [Polyangiaceae bacterium]|nr:FIST C-terminal domain-containing protein [Polyangiaceae bacterium]
MRASAASVAVKAQTPERVAKGIEEALGKLPNASAGLVFVSGALAHQLPEVSAEAAKVARGTPLLISAGAGVLTERGELEDQPAAAVLAWSGGTAEPLTVQASNAEELGEALARVLGDRAGRSTLTGFVFVRPDGFGPQAFEPLQQARGLGNLFGAGTLSGIDSHCVDARGQVLSGAASILLLRGSPAPSIRASPACRLLMPLARITETRGSMVVSIEDEPALDVLSATAQELADQPLVFVVLAPEDVPGQERSGRPELLVRAVQGVDPVRRSLLVSDEVRTGMRIAFAVRDAAAARTDLEAVTRDLERDIAGAAPRFGVYINCAGRGSSLYGAYDVDTRILRARFGDIPMAGMQSSFEIAPHGGKPTLQLYTGVLGLFTTLS